LREGKVEENSKTKIQKGENGKTKFAGRLEKNPGGKGENGSGLRSGLHPGPTVWRKTTGGKEKVSGK